MLGTVTLANVVNGEGNDVEMFIGANIFGLRMMQITRAKLGANDEARKAIGKLVSEVRSAKLVKIGTGSLSTFTEVGVDTLQKGSALQLYTIDDNTNQFIRYFGQIRVIIMLKNQRQLTVSNTETHLAVLVKIGVRY